MHLKDARGGASVLNLLQRRCPYFVCGVDQRRPVTVGGRSALSGFTLCCAMFAQLGACHLGPGLGLSKCRLLTFSPPPRAAGDSSWGVWAPLPQLLATARGGSGPPSSSC